MRERDEPFSVLYRVGRTPYHLDVSPEWDEEEQEACYRISLNSADIGILKKNNLDVWIWADGGFEGIWVEGVETDINSAENIGRLIETHAVQRS